MFVTLFLIIYCLFLYGLCNKDVESTSGSGPESFYTPEPSPTDRHSSSSGGLCSELLSIFEVLYLRPEGCNVKLGRGDLCHLQSIFFPITISMCVSRQASERKHSGV